MGKMSRKINDKPSALRERFNVHLPKYGTLWRNMIKSMNEGPSNSALSQRDLNVQKKSVTPSKQDGSNLVQVTNFIDAIETGLQVTIKGNQLHRDSGCDVEGCLGDCVDPIVEFDDDSDSKEQKIIKDRTSPLKNIKQLSSPKSSSSQDEVNSIAFNLSHMVLESDSDEDDLDQEGLNLTYFEDDIEDEAENADQQSNHQDSQQNTAIDTKAYSELKPSTTSTKLETEIDNFLENSFKISVSDGEQQPYKSPTSASSCTESTTNSVNGSVQTTIEDTDSKSEELAEEISLTNHDNNHHDVKGRDSNLNLSESNLSVHRKFIEGMETKNHDIEEESLKSRSEFTDSKSTSEEEWNDESDEESLSSTTSSIDVPNRRGSFSVIIVSDDDISYCDDSNDESFHTAGMDLSDIGEAEENSTNAIEREVDANYFNPKVNFDNSEDFANDLDHSIVAISSSDESNFKKPTKKKHSSIKGKKIKLKTIQKENNEKTQAKTSSINSRAFKQQREKLSMQLFDDYNSKAFDNALSLVPVVWSKRLLTTAGLTRLKRKGQIKSASIELSVKVIDDLERLRATLLHEMCHAAQWLVDGVAKPAHGDCFKKWARVAMKKVTVHVPH